MDAKALVRAGLAGLAALALAAPTVSAQNTARPNATSQPLADGCQRNPAGLLAYTSPEWVYVYRDRTPRMLAGTAVGTHTASGDLPEGHDWYDLNSNVDPDPGYEYLVAGDPAAKNGNFAPGDESTNRVHVEWETGTVPKYIWPTEGDRVKLWGSWIWDCGHWGQNYRDPDYFLPGTGEPIIGASNLRGEQTEFHPMRAMVVTRAAPSRPVVPETETDVFISSEGTQAHAQAECTLDHPAPAGNTGYAPDYSACVNTASEQHQVVNDRDYTFFVPAPPRPSSRAHLRYRVVDMLGGRNPVERVDVKSNGIEVTVPFKGFGSASDTQRYGKIFFVGWEGGGGDQPDGLELELKRLTVFHSLDPNPDHPSSSGTPPGEYNLYLEANGDWRFLNDWVPGLGSVLDGQSFDVGHSVRIAVPPGKAVRVYTHGRECDLPKINPCYATGEVADDNDLPGDAVQTFPSAAAAVGDHSLKPKSGNYELRYSVGRTSLACASDVFAPRSAFNRKRRARKVSRRRISLRGRARDQRCLRRRGKIRRTEVALTLKRGKRSCRYARRVGKRGRVRLRKRGSCRRPVWLKARGTKRWRIRLRGRFPRGRYVAFVRSIDSAGNVERRRTRRTRLSFRRR